MGKVLNHSDIRREGANMSLDKASFLGSFGFSEHPFELTSADEEPALASYFVPPPYFAAVLGSPSSPKSSVVFAPRGGGKSAQKVMIEKVAEQGDLGQFLCVVYDSFILPGGFKPEDATIEWHLRSILQRILMGCLISIEENPKKCAGLSAKQKNSLAKLCFTFLSELNEEELHTTINSLRNWSGKLDYYWGIFGGAALQLISSCLKYLGLGPIDKLDLKINTNGSSVSEYLLQSISIVRSIGYQSVYILVDRVDEMSLTQNSASNTYSFIRSLVSDLHVLEMDGIAFKFFLWDIIRGRYARESRPDRVRIYDLEWSADQLSEMLAKRIHAISSGNISSFNELFEKQVRLDFHTLICHLANGSPRDMIRLAKAIVDEQTRDSNYQGLISFASAEEGIKKFSNQRIDELYADNSTILTRIGLTVFHLDSVEERFGDSAKATATIRDWEDLGAVRGVRQEGISEDGYALTDPRAVITAKRSDRLSVVLSNNLRLCAACKSVNSCEESQIQVDCFRCGRDVPRSSSLLVMLTRLDDDWPKTPALEADADNSVNIQIRFQTLGPDGTPRRADDPMD